MDFLLQSGEQCLPDQFLAYSNSVRCKTKAACGPAPETLERRRREQSPEVATLYGDGPSVQTWIGLNNPGSCLSFIVSIPSGFVLEFHP